MNSFFPPAQGLSAFLFASVVALCSNLMTVSAEPFTADQLRSRATTEALLRQIDGLVSHHQESLEEARSRGDEDDAEDDADTLEKLAFVRSRLTAQLGEDASPAERFQVNSYTDRILQTVEVPVEGALLPPLDELFTNVVTGALIGQPLPGVSKHRQSQPLGEKRAARESLYLHNPINDQFFSTEEIAKLTPEEVSQLDVSPGNPIWYDRQTLERLSPDPIGYFKKNLDSGVSRMLRDDGVLSGGESYAVDSARKVLFLNYIFNSATAPKGSAEDAFGVSWKLKWGPEASIEPITWQLYILAGGKMTDLTLVNGNGPADMTLILLDPDEDYEEKSNLAYPTNTEEFLTAIKDFYGFDLEAYVHSSGTITRENVDAVLRNLPGGGKSEYRKEKMIGRNWISFCESNIELGAKGFLVKHDGARLSDVVAVNDRATRGSYLFDMWVGNRDVKDDNSRAYFLKGIDGTSSGITDYREGHHDQGLTIGSLFAAGDVNGFHTGHDFASRGLFGKIRFKQAVLFRPKAWDAATWADGKWMARNIVAITDAQIRDVVTASGWPDFGQEVIVYKLIDRRNRIAALFDLVDRPELQQSNAPTITIDLGSPAQVSAIEKKYALDPGSLAAELAEIKAGPGYSETVVKKGQIAKDNQSALVRTLVRQRFPTGVSSRYQMMSKKPPKALRE